MNSGNHVRAASHALKAMGLALALATLPQAALAAATPQADYATPAAGAAGSQAPVAMDKGAASAEVAGNPVNNSGPTADTATSTAYTPMKPTPGIGMPVDGGIGLQAQFSPTGQYGHWIHNIVLIPLIAAITLLVLVLLVMVVVKFNRRSNPVASRTSHNTALEVAWTLVPVLILVCIAVPSIDLIAKQYKSAPAKSLTVKITGNQWFWTYAYPDNGDFEVNSYMLNLPGQPVINAGVREVGSKAWDGPSHLEVDNRMVVPAGEPIRLQITAADVIHSFGILTLVQAGRRPRPHQREGALHRQAGRLLWPVFRALRRQAWLHADRHRGSAARAVQRMGACASRRPDRRSEEDCRHHDIDRARG